MSRNDEDEKKGFRPGVHVERPSRQRPIKLVNPETGEVTGLTKPSEIVQSLLEQHGIATSLTPAQQVEEDLKAITVCEQCREKPLGMKRWSIQERRHRERPWICGACILRNHQASVTPEQRRQIALKWHASMDPERRAEWYRKSADRSMDRIRSMTPEQRSVFIHKSRDGARKNHASMTPEQRSDIARRRAASMTPEQRSERARKANASRTAQQRRDSALRGKAAMTPEQRSEAARKAAATKRAKKEQAA